MSVAPLRKKATETSGQTFRSAVSELAANELIFGVVGPVGSGTSEIAETLEALLNQNGYDTTILKARDVIVADATKQEHPIPDKRSLIQSLALQDAGDSLRQRSKDNAAVAVGLVLQIRSLRAAKQQSSAAGVEPIEPDGTKRAYILDSLRHPDEVVMLRRIYQEAFCLIGVYCYQEERVRRLRDEKYRDASTVEVTNFVERDENAPEAYGQKVADTFHLAMTA